jgi:hypothetical protein
MKKRAKKQKHPSEVTAGGILLCAAASAYGDPNSTMKADAVFNLDLVSGILAAATAGGYDETPMLETALKERRYSASVLAMADKACLAAGATALRAALDQAVMNRFLGAKTGQAGLSVKPSN